MDLLAVRTARQAVAEVDQGSAKGQDGLRLLVARQASHDCLDSCKELRAAEGFYDVVIGSRLECCYPLLLGRPRAQDEYCDGRPATYVDYEVDAVTIRQAQIQDADVGTVTLRL